ncbi:hypothetical protein [Streptomyces flavofungini]|uniref:hypothetical protein n=1 Tax=Streptomyces flavofungini TaxID=68200 RepID=UPI0025B0AB10|nr:hypothetical protein [Streptomyces flavofungini]WJV51721.1 hypothetical protein QUY26_40390 [Streptomyces flavofungini]
MFVVTVDTRLGAVVVAPECTDDLDDLTCTVITGAEFTWRPDLEAFTHPGEDRQAAADISLRLVVLGHDVLAA